MLRKVSSIPDHKSRRRAGFTLAELLVSMVVLVQILLIALLMFDFNSRVTRVQTNLAEMQQSLRVGQQEVVRMTRMAGRSGLPVTAPSAPVGGPTPAARLAVQVLNNVTGAARIVLPDEADSPMAIQGTDILILRGNFSTPLYNFTLTSIDNRSNPTAGVLLVRRVDPFNPEQDLAPLASADDAETGIPEALILMPSTPGVAYAVVELLPNTVGNTADEITVSFRVRGDEFADAYHALWTNDPDNTAFPMLTGASGYMAILEEYRFYVRNDGGASAESARPRLSRARLLPGTGTAHGDPGVENPPALSLRADIADNILDLQVALGFDTNIDGAVIGPDGLGAIVETDTGVNDDWLYNSAADDDTASPFLEASAANVPNLFFVRVTTLARTTSAERTDRDLPLTALEDHVYPADSGLVNSTNALKFRRSFLQTTVDLRNL